MAEALGFRGVFLSDFDCAGYYTGLGPGGAGSGRKQRLSVVRDCASGDPLFVLGPAASDGVSKLRGAVAAALTK